MGDMIRQGEEVRDREKCGGLVLVIEGVCITHPFKGMCPAWAIPSGNCRKSASSALLCGRGQREFEGPSDPIFTGACLCIAKEGDGVGSEPTFSGATASICDLLGLVFNSRQEGLRGSSG